MISYALTTKQRLIDFLGLENLTSAQEGVVEYCIESATDFIENFCSRRFKQTARTGELHSGTGQKTLILDHFPIVKGETFKLYERQTNLNQDSWDSINSKYYFIDYEEGTIHYEHGSFRKGKHRWKVDYTSGFDFDNTETFPNDVGLADLEYIVWKLAGTMYLKRRGSVGIRQEAMHSTQVTYMKLVMESDEIKEVLDKYASSGVNSELYA